MGIDESAPVKKAKHEENSLDYAAIHEEEQKLSNNQNTDKKTEDIMLYENREEAKQSTGKQLNEEYTKILKSESENEPWNIAEIKVSVTGESNSNEVSENKEGNHPWIF